MSENAFLWEAGEIFKAIKRRSMPEPSIVEPWVDDIISIGVILSCFSSDIELYLADGQFYVGKRYYDDGSYQMYVEDQAHIAVFTAFLKKETEVYLYSSGPWEILLVRYEKLVRKCKAQQQDPFQQNMGIGIVRKSPV